MPWVVITFIGDLRGTYPLGGDNFLFPVKISDMFVFRFGGGRMFYETNEAFVSIGFRAVSLGLRYYGTGDSLFSDYSGYVAYRLGRFGFSASFGSNSVGHLKSTYGGALFSVEGWSTPVLLRVSAGYSVTPILVSELEIRREDSGLRVAAISRPGLYLDLSLYPYVNIGDVDVGGLYRTSGNTFGFFVTYTHALGFSSILLSAHESLGESVFADNLLIWR